MSIDLHIHSKSSDGKWSVDEIVNEAFVRDIEFISITDHDNTSCQKKAALLTRKKRIRYVSGVELNVTFSHPRYHEGKPVSLDFLGYHFDSENRELTEKLQRIAAYRQERAGKIMDNLNASFEEQGIKKLTKKDFGQIRESADGVLGRPHIADFLVKHGIVKDRQDAFDKYLVKCDVPKYPLYLDEASKLMRKAGGKVVLAHPNDPHGTSLASLSKSLSEQTEIVRESILPFIDGIECWHSRSDVLTTNHYVKFAREHALLMTGGSDCHQKPVLMGTVSVPEWVADQFRL